MRHALLTLALLPFVAVAQTEATYSVTFDATWSAATHPDAFPPGPHFSGLVGATHDGRTRLWRVGEAATLGIESMAETGAQATLLGEVDTYIGDGTAGTALSGGFIATSPGSVSMTFTTSEAHPLVSLVSMLAPSPDWFVGTDALALRDADGWIQEVVVPLDVYDAGTDSGPSYTSPDADTDPQEAIAKIEASPFKVGDDLVPVGTFTFALQAVVDTDDERPQALRLSAPSPNPSASQVTLTLQTAQPGNTVDVVDVQGRRIAHRTMSTPGAHRLSFDTSAWAPGLYVVRATDGRVVARTRMMVAR